MKHMKIILGVMLIVLITGCATSGMVHVTILDKAYPSKNPSKVRVYIGNETVKRSYKQIAMINADDEGWEKSDQELIMEMKVRAAHIGADAIIINNQQMQSAGGVFIGTAYVQSNKKIIKGIAIKFDK